MIDSVQCYTCETVSYSHMQIFQGVTDNWGLTNSKNLVLVIVDVVAVVKLIWVC